MGWVGQSAYPPPLRDFATRTEGRLSLTSLSSSRLGDVTVVAQGPEVRSQERLPGSLVSEDDLGPEEARLTNYKAGGELPCLWGQKLFALIPGGLSSLLPQTTKTGVS